MTDQGLDPSGAILLRLLGEGVNMTDFTDDELLALMLDGCNADELAAASGVAIGAMTSRIDALNRNVAPDCRQGSEA